MKIDRVQGFGAYAKCVPVREAVAPRRRMTEDQLREAMLADAAKMPRTRAITDGATPQRLGYGPKTRADAWKFIHSNGGNPKKPAPRQAFVLRKMLELEHASALELSRVISGESASNIHQTLRSIERRGFIRETDGPTEDERYPVYALALLGEPTE